MIQARDMQPWRILESAFKTYQWLSSIPEPLKQQILQARCALVIFKKIFPCDSDVQF